MENAKTVMLSLEKHYNSISSHEKGSAMERQINEVNNLAHLLEKSHSSAMLALSQAIRLIYIAENTPPSTKTFCMKTPAWQMSTKTSPGHYANSQASLPKPAKRYVQPYTTATPFSTPNTHTITCVNYPIFINEKSRNKRKLLVPAEKYNKLGIPTKKSFDSFVKDRFMTWIQFFKITIIH